MENKTSKNHIAEGANSFTRTKLWSQSDQKNEVWDPDEAFIRLSEAQLSQKERAFVDKDMEVMGTLLSKASPAIFVGVL